MPAQPSQSKSYVPFSIRTRSKTVAWLWRHLPASWLPYDRARWLAERLP